MQYTVTLNFSFLPGFPYDDKQEAAFDITDKYYEEKGVIAHIKGNDAMKMVEYICCDGNVASASWDPTKFAIHLVIETSLSADQLHNDLLSNSLEDGEYEACSDSGWILFTRNTEGATFEYGLVDYRQNPIEVGLWNT